MEDEMFEMKSSSPRKRNRKPEAKVQKAIIAWLLEHKVVLAVTDAGALAKLGLGISCGIPAGWPDITGCVRGGRFIGVECKAPGGKQSQDQKVCEAAIHNNGGHYCLAQSVEDVKNYFLTHGLMLDIC
jgi:hypothetical protein